jgi:hypothetical protein
MDEVLHIALATPLPGRPLPVRDLEPVKMDWAGDERVTH